MLADSFVCDFEDAMPWCDAPVELIVCMRGGDGGWAVKKKVSVVKQHVQIKTNTHVDESG